MNRLAWTVAWLALALALTRPGMAGWKSEGPWLGTVHAVALDPSHPETVFAATSGGGVWRTTSGGESWSLAGAELAHRNVLWLQLDPKKPRTVYAGTEGEGHGAIWRTTDNGDSWKAIHFPHTVSIRPDRLAWVPGNPSAVWLPDVNLHLRSADGGTTWTEFRVAEMDVTVFAFDPVNPKIVWAGGTGEKVGLRKSQDGGATWKPANEGMGSSSVRGLIIDPKNPKTMYAWSPEAKAFRSTDGGATWAQLEGELKGLACLELDPGHPQTLFACTKGGLVKSADGGASWKGVDRGLPDYLVHAVAFNPARPEVVFAGSAGSGMFKSMDGGESWTAINKGLASAWVERLWADPVTPRVVFAQTETGLFQSDASGNWRELRKPFLSERDSSAKVAAVIFDRRNSKVVHVATLSTYYRSSDGGTTWSSPLKDFQDASFRSLALEPSDPKILYSGDWTDHGDPGRAVYKSGDGGGKWKAAGKGMPGADVVRLLCETPKTLFALTKESGLFKSADGATTWTKIGEGLPAKGVRELVLDPANSSALYAATKKGIYRSTDGGGTFSLANSGLTDPDVESVAVGNGGQVFAATFKGVFRSTDAGATWTPFGDGLVHHDVRALSFGAGNRLYAGTAGGSVYSIELP